MQIIPVPFRVYRNRIWQYRFPRRIVCGHGFEHRKSFRFRPWTVKRARKRACFLHQFRGLRRRGYRKSFKFSPVSLKTAWGINATSLCQCIAGNQDAGKHYKQTETHAHINNSHFFSAVKTRAACGDNERRVWELSTQILPLSSSTRGVYCPGRPVAAATRALPPASTNPFLISKNAECRHSPSVLNKFFPEAAVFTRISKGISHKAKRMKLCKGHKHAPVSEATEIQQ